MNKKCQSQNENKNKIKMLKTLFYFDDVTLLHQESIYKKVGIKLATCFSFISRKIDL